MSGEPEVIVGRDGALGRLTLNRPAALHALTTNMCELMTAALLEWRTDPSLHAVLVDHSGERGFCAGGDIRSLAESGAGDGAAARHFFFTEYRLNHLLFVYPKPVVTVMDGITMGGGVGLALPSQFRIATERTTLAMPETGIGLFPDVGGGWFLPRLPGAAGLWMALTGARLKAADCLSLGLATQFTASADLAALKVTLAADAEQPAQVLASFAADPGAAPIAAVQSDIDRLFTQASVEDVFDALAADGSDWASAQLATLRTKSPMSMKVAQRQLRTGGALTDFADNMAMEYRIGARVVQSHDFLEGVRAVIVDKDNAPRWDPATLQDLSDTALDDIFAPLSAGQEWSPLPDL